MRRIITITDTRKGMTSDPDYRAPVDIHTDGTCWVNPQYPLVITKHLEDRETVFAKYKAAHAAGTLAKVADPAHIARLGQMGPFLIEESADRDARVRAANANKPPAEITTMEVHVSSRGWGDYNSIYWKGAANKPTDEIMAECRQLMAQSYDVDHINQTDEELAAKIEEARTELAEQNKKNMDRYIARLAAEKQKAADLDGLDIQITKTSEVDEGGRATVYKIAITLNGKTWRFIDRNIFDVGRCINPDYAITPGSKPGGLGQLNDSGAHWMDFQGGANGKGWIKVRDMDPDEEHAYRVVERYLGHAGASIRM